MDEREGVERSFWELEMGAGLGGDLVGTCSVDVESVGSDSSRDEDAPGATLTSDEVVKERDSTVGSDVRFGVARGSKVGVSSERTS